eukprot:12351866-Ditylum_brightwellii.AAC.1
MLQNLPSVVVAHALLSDYAVPFQQQQQPSSLSSSLETKEKNKLTILDMCSAPGGKTSHMASLLSRYYNNNQDFIIVACDKSRSKMVKARNFFESMNATCIVPLALDTTKCVADDGGEYGESSSVLKSVEE